jgi:TM2 domain-containing membrane protein YozV
MIAVICPYCRAPVDEQQDEMLVCPACGTPHHADCFHENGGCTVFGCASAPPAEPKLSIGAPDLNSPQPAPATMTVNRAAPPPPPPLSPPPPPPWPQAPAATDFYTPPLFSSTGYNSGTRNPPVAQPRIAPNPHFVDPHFMEPGLNARNRTAFMLLGVLLGAFGAHSFYAGSIKKGFLQLAITVLTLGLAGFMVWIWAVIDICTITTDSDGVPFRN